MFGNKHFDVDDADIIIDDVRYADTPGLYELIFKKILDLFYREDNMNEYKSMLLKVQGAIDVCVCARSSPTRTRLLNNRWYKYKYVIALSITSKKQKKKSEKGLPRAMTQNDKAIDYMHESIPTSWWIVYDRFAPSGQQRSQQRDAVDHRGTSRNWYYKLNRVSTKRVSRVASARKNTFALCITCRMKKRCSEKKTISSKWR